MSERTTVLIPFLKGKYWGRQWLDDCLRSFPGQQYIVCENNGEMAEALNQGLERVRSEYVMVFGADDVMLPGALELLESLIWDVDVVYPSMILTDDGLLPFGEFPADPFDGNRLLQWNFVSGGFLARTAALRKVGGWRDLESLEDWDLHVRMFRSGARFKPVPEAKFLYRQTPKSRNKIQTGELSREKWQSLIVGDVPRVDATFYYQATPAITYWRCQLPARYLPGRCLSQTTFEMDESDVWMPEHEGAMILQLAGSKHEAAILTVMAPKLGIRTLVEVDDNYLETSPSRKRQGWQMKIGQGIYSLEGHRKIVEKVDGLIVTSERLAQAYRSLNPNIYVCPNSVDPDDWPPIKKPDDGICRIGWFASLSHQGDGKLIYRALEWASRQKDVEVWTMGFHPRWKFPHRHIPWSNDLAVYWKAMEVLDIGLCPVIPTPWAVCRSDVKALEYSLGGAMPLVSAEAPYDLWENEQGCLKARTAKGFYEAVKWLVANRDEARRMAVEAKEYVLRERTIESNIHRWREAVRDG